MTAYQLRALLCRASSLPFVLTEHISSYSVAYPAVSTTLPEGCSMGFVPWFLLL